MQIQSPKGAALTLKSPKKIQLFWKKLCYNVKRYKFIYLLMLPGILYFAVFSYYPMYFLQIAFRKYSIYTGLEGAKWVGLKNFADLFQSTFFLQALGNTIILSVMNLVFAFPVPIILALLLNEIHNQLFKRTVQTLIYLPHFLSWVIVGSIWITMLSPSSGLVNYLLGLFGIEPVFFMASKDHFRWVLLLSHIWKGAGWGTIVYLAAITGIDQQMYEAAIVDGASRLKQTLYITLPSILPTILVVFILNLAKILNIFEQVFAMYNPVVAEVSETIDTYVYQIGIIKGDMSFATAAGLFKNIVSMSLVLITNAIARRVQESSVV